MGKALRGKKICPPLGRICPSVPMMGQSLGHFPDVCVIGKGLLSWLDSSTLVPLLSHVCNPLFYWPPLQLVLPLDLGIPKCFVNSSWWRSNPIQIHKDCMESLLRFHCLVPLYGVLVWNGTNTCQMRPSQRSCPSSLLSLLCHGIGLSSILRRSAARWRSRKPNGASLG